MSINIEKLKRFIILLGEKAKEIEGNQKKPAPNLNSPDLNLSYEDKIRELIKIIRQIKDKDEAFFIYATHRLSYISNIQDKNKREIILDELLMQSRERLIKVEEEKQVEVLEKKVVLKEQLLSLKIFIGNIRKLSRKKNLSKSQERELKKIEKRALKLKQIIEKKLKEISGRENKKTKKNSNKKRKAKKSKKASKEKKRVNGRSKVKKVKKNRKKAKKKTKEKKIKVRRKRKKSRTNGKK